MIEEKYNETFHRGIKMTPLEAFNNKDDEKVKDLNSKTGEYANAFKEAKRENFSVNQRVRIANK